MRHGRVPPAPLGDGRGEHAVTVDAGPWPAAPLEVAVIAAAVDEGRALAARAARDGAGVVVLRAAGAADESMLERVAAWTARAGGGAAPDGPYAADPGAAAPDATAPGAAEPAGPLSALRRYGDGPLAVAFGVVLGAGEHGLACRCADRAASVAAALAIMSEPDLRGRVSAVPTAPPPR
jgi:hypothetical protein